MPKVNMPEVAAGATYAVINRWTVEEGADVNVGDVICELETDKAVVEYAAEVAGKLTKIIGQPGEEIDVGDPICIIGDDVEAEASAPAAAPEAPAAEAPVAAPVASPVVETPAAPAPAAPAAEAPTRVEGERIFASPIARKMASDNGIDVATIQGTGPDGRIVRRDVEAAIAAGPATPAAPAPAAPAAQPAQTSSSTELAPQDYSSSYTAIKHSGMRKAIARRLTESKSTIPHFYLYADCRVDELIELRKKLNEISPVKISVNDMVIRAIAAAFQDVPEANVVWTDDAMLKYESVDISVAVATETGLLTPVLRGVEKRSLSNIASNVKDLAERSREGKLRQDELEGGSFAITNLGMYGTEQFAAIINPPQSGILAVGAASEKVIAEQGQMTVATIMSVTLSADHRAVDGALAAEWLKAFKHRIENPLTMLV
jgi:pyruvate dehydrogenase E2 component (dihydrolipoamide acetyltransferase)